MERTSQGEQPGWIRLLADSHEGLRAYFLHFLEVACLGHLVVCCARLRGGLWLDGPFWRAYAGPCLDGEPPEREVATLRSVFRKWLFHLDGPWVRDLAQCKEAGERSEFGADYKQLLDDARCLASGIMPCDDDGSSLQEFVALISALLCAYDPRQLDERGAAEAAVAQVERRADVFTAAQMGEVSLAYEQSVERAVLDQTLEEEPESNHDPFFDPVLEEDSEHGSDRGVGAPFAMPSMGAGGAGLPMPPLGAAPLPDSFWQGGGLGSGGDDLLGQDVPLDGQQPTHDAMESFWRDAADGAGGLGLLSFSFPDEAAAPASGAAGLWGASDGHAEEEEAVSFWRPAGAD